ncbi:MAG: glycosyltransferase, partial [Bradymonadaceae bacterium]
VHVDYGLRPLVQYVFERARRRPRDLWPPHRMFMDGVTEHDGSLYVGDSYSPLFAGIFGHGHPVRDYFTFDKKVLMTREFVRRNQLEDPIVWVYHPGFGDCVNRISRKLLIYDCVDNYAAFPTYRDDPEWLMAREERLCRNADLVFTTSSALYESRRPFNPENTHLVHNVGDATHFKRAMDDDLAVPDDIASIQGPVIGFVGALSDYKLNIEWLIHLADSRPNINIVLIGPIGMADRSTNVTALRRRSNIHLLGYRDYADLPAYIKGFDVAVIPYRINDYTSSVFPIKFFEFMASGKPVVISNLPALRAYYDDVEVACHQNDFVAACDRALLDEDALRKRARVALAERNSWSSRIGAIMTHVNAKLRTMSA